MFSRKINTLSMGVLFFCIFSALLTACSPASAAGKSTSLTPKPTAVIPTIQSSSTPPQIFPASISLADTLPQNLAASFKPSSALTLASDPSQASVQVVISPLHPVSTWIYALVAPFPTVTDGVNLNDLLAFWTAKPGGAFAAQKLLVSPETLAALESLWGKPATPNVTSTPAGQILQEAWKGKNTWAVIPFEAIEPKWKVIRVDGQSPLQKDFNAGKYPLKVIFSIEGDAAVVDAILEKFGPTSPEPFIAVTNRDADLLTTVLLTGVTALVRGTASMMEVKGMTYPDQNIRDILRGADILHISNEIPFSPKCPPPYPASRSDLVFCSRPEYIQLLEDAGTDIVELTGDHFQDWGNDAMLYTLEMYKKEGWPYYGGGANIEEARKPVLLENHSNKIAFLGCNAKGPGYAGARENQPGAVLCDIPLMQKQVRELVSQGYQPIVTFQHLEYYSYEAHPLLKADFEALADAGAVIVSGSQAHQPHAMEFDKGAFLHYGLGNLFFDQFFEGDPEKTAFLDRHFFYNGKYINTELISLQFVDLAQSRLMTDDERQVLLATVFKASGW